MRKNVFRIGSSVSVKILKYAMSSSGKSQREVAIFLRVHYSHISKIIHRHRQLTLDEIELLAKGLGLNMPVLVWRALKPAGKPKETLDEIDELFLEIYPECGE